MIDVSADSAYSWGGVPLALARERAHGGRHHHQRPGRALPHLLRPAGGRRSRGEFARRIIGGPASFVVTADGDTSFADAVRKKLLLEIAGLVPGGPARTGCAAAGLTAPTPRASVYLPGHRLVETAALFDARPPRTDAAR